MKLAAYKFNRVWGQLVLLCREGESQCDSPEADYYRNLMADLYADMTDEEYKASNPDISPGGWIAVYPPPKKPGLVAMLANLFSTRKFLR